ncbi:MAG: hypothetical protein M3O46_05725 [Myxococcota bacterium]|nr:hypothetical protein [Myxococcota bacterium]
MVAKIEAIAARLFEDVMAPLVLGGALRPGRAIGTRAALALRDFPTVSVDAKLEIGVREMRVRRARELVSIDELGPPDGADWMLAAGLHDVLQAANPRFDTALRRRSATRILDLAEATIDAVGPPSNVHEALSRHVWLARVLDIARTDTGVSCWSGSRIFLGVEPPPRWLSWPRLRRVKVVRASHTFLELGPLAIERERFVQVAAKLLDRTPLTEIATCTRAAPPFAWSGSTLALVATRAGQTLALRALARLPATEVDATLGRATRKSLAMQSVGASIAVALIAHRAIAHAQEGGFAIGRGLHVGRPSVSSQPTSSTDMDVAFARNVGAAAAIRVLQSPSAPWPDAERRRLLTALEPTAGAAHATLAELDERAR